MVGRFFYYLLNVFFTIVPLNMLFRIFPSEKRKSRDVYLASIFYAIFFLWMLPVPTAIASRYTMIFIYPFTAFNMFFFLGGSKSFKFIFFCLYFNVLMLIEATSSLILSLIGLLFPGLHITGIFVAFEGNDISISLLCTIEMIVYLIIFSFVIRFISTHAYLLRLSLLISLLLPILLPMILNNIFTILSQNSLPTYIYLIPALISSFLIFRLFRHGIHLLKDSEKENAIEQHRLLTVQQEIDHLHSLDQEYQKLYVWNHDMANHLLALSLLSEQEKYDQALSYMKQLQENGGNIK